jgi:hypothetical protein
MKFFCWHDWIVFRSAECKLRNGHTWEHIFEDQIIHSGWKNGNLFFLMSKFLTKFAQSVTH